MIRFAAYNLSGAVEPGAASEVLRAIQADVVCALEVGGRSSARRLARGCGMNVAGRVGRRRQAAAILVGERVRVLSVSHHELTSFPGMPARGVLQSIVGVGGIRIAVFAVQFGLRPDVREAHVADVERLVANVSAPVVVGADLNEAAGGPTTARLTEVLQDAFVVAGSGSGETFPNPTPLSRKDVVLVDRDLAVLAASVPNEPPVDVASHHRPVVADLAEPGEEPVDATEEPAA